VSEKNAMQLPVRRIAFRTQVGRHMLSASDGPLVLSVRGQPKPLRHHRRGPLWLALVCGPRFEIPLVDDGR
jgi:hypothetical protein